MLFLLYALARIYIWVEDSGDPLSVMEFFQTKNLESATLCRGNCRGWMILAQNIAFQESCNLSRKTFGNHYPNAVRW